MSNVEQLSDYQKKDDVLNTEYITFLRTRCNAWLDQKAYEHFHTDEALAMLINIKKRVSKHAEVRKAYIDFMKRLENDSFTEFERLRLALEEKNTNISL